MILEIKKWYCRLGNNIVQVKNALHIAIHYNYNLNIPEHKFFNKKNIILNPKIGESSKIYHDILGINFFYKNKIVDFPQNIFNENNERVRELLMDLFVIKYETLDKLGDNDAVIHIRSGDIFSQYPHTSYILPPLFYYYDIIKNNNFSKIYLISEDDKNPCINELIKIFPQIIFKINDIYTDIKLIMGAQNIICSFGTFVSSLLFMTKYTKNVFTVSYYQKKYCDISQIQNLNLHILDYEKYHSKISKWKNTKEQNNILLNYKQESAF